MLLVCHDQAEIRGYIDARLLHQIGEILGLYIKPAYRRQGIGSTLVKRVINIFTGRKCQKVRVKVLTKNRGAIDFFTQLQFTMEATPPEEDNLVLLSRRL